MNPWRGLLCKRKAGFRLDTPLLGILHHFWWRKSLNNGGEGGMAIDYRDDLTKQSECF